MYYKIIACPCYVELTMQREDNVINRINHFHCHCNVPHEILVWVCSSHPTVCTISSNSPMQCFYKNCSHYELCSLCVERRYIINFKAKKICLGEIPDYTKNDVIKFDYFLKEKMKSEAFYFFCNNIVICSLDNPKYYDIIKNVKRPAN